MFDREEEAKKNIPSIGERLIRRRNPKFSAPTLFPGGEPGSYRETAADDAS